jgi:hypothetical protein
VDAGLRHYYKNGAASTLYDEDAAIEFVKVDGFDTNWTHGAQIHFKTTANNRDQAPVSMMTLDQNGHVILSPADVASVNSAYTNGLRFDIHQTNGQDARLGEITAQGKSNWGGDLVFRTKDANGSPNNTVTERMRILGGGGITFNGDTAAANALDDYEEGNWTPTTSSFSGHTLGSVTNAEYVKIGRLVFIRGYINFSTSPTGGVFRITNLPFTPNTGGYGRHAVALQSSFPLVSNTSYNEIVGTIGESSAEITIYKSNLHGITTIPASDVNTATNLYFCGSYQTA